jgi:hypothetical protein
MGLHIEGGDVLWNDYIIYPYKESDYKIILQLDKS